VEKPRTVTTGRIRPKAAILAMVLLRSSFAYLSLVIPPATPVQAPVYSYFVLQPQGNGDQQRKQNRPK
jgi:hypothetical protein